jgi:beta-galactosidase
MTKGYELYEQFFFEGFPLGFVTQNILQKQDNSNWDTVVVYNNDFVTDDEFEALQTYLDQGGSIIVASPASLTKNEYGQVRNQTLSANSVNSRLVVLPQGTGLESIKTEAMKHVEALPDISIVEDNGQDFKTTMSRSVKQDDGSYLVNILNLGHNKASIQLSLKGSKDLKITNLMTSNTMDSKFDVPSEGVLLLQVKPL